MFISIRRYENAQLPSAIRERVEKEFLPLLTRTPGFMGYHLVDCGNGTIASISMFDSRESALASNTDAKEWVRQHLPDMLPQPAQIVTGETILSSVKPPTKVVL